MPLTLRERFAGLQHISAGVLGPDREEADALVAAGHWRKVHLYEDGDGQDVEWDPSTGMIEGYEVESVATPDGPMWRTLDGSRGWFGWSVYRSLDESRVQPATVLHRLGVALLAQRGMEEITETMTETEVQALIERVLASG